LNWADLSLTYLSFEQRGNSVVRHLAVKGPMIAANFSF